MIDLYSPENRAMALQENGSGLIPYILGLVIKSPCVGVLFLRKFCDSPRFEAINMGDYLSNASEVREGDNILFPGPLEFGITNSSMCSLELWDETGRILVPGLDEERTSFGRYFSGASNQRIRQRIKEHCGYCLEDVLLAKRADRLYLVDVNCRNTVPK